jgi:hypothetical protein
MERLLCCDDDELVINPPTPCQIGKRPPAPKTRRKRPAIRESQVEGAPLNRPPGTGRSQPRVRVLRRSGGADPGWSDTRSQGPYPREQEWGKGKRGKASCVAAHHTRSAIAIRQAQPGKPPKKTRGEREGDAGRRERGASQTRQRAALPCRG